MAGGWLFFFYKSQSANLEEQFKAKNFVKTLYSSEADLTQGWQYATVCKTRIINETMSEYVNFFVKS